MTSGPDFIVDPAGIVRDVRHPKTSHSASAAPPPRSATDNLAENFYRGKVVHVSTPPVPRKSSSLYLIPIPVGLIVFLVIALLNLLSGSSSSTVNTVSETEYFELRQGVNYYLKGNYTLALNSFNSILRSRPNLAEAHNGRGLVYLDMGEYDKALQDFNRAIEILPSSAVAYSNRGITYLARADYTRAISDLDKAIALDTDFAKAYYNRGLVYYGLGDLTAALSNFNQAIRDTREDTRPSQFKATVNPKQDLLADFNAYWDLYEADADLPAAYYWRARVYVDQGDFEQAIRDLEKANQLGPDADQALEIDGLLEMLAGYRSHSDG